MYRHVQRQRSTAKKRLRISLCFESPMLVQLKGRASWEPRRDLSGWAVDGWKPAEARGSWAQANWCFWGTRALPMASWIPGCAGVCRPWLPCRLLTPQDGLWFAPDLLAVWSRLSRGGWEGYIHLLFAGACGGLTCCAVRRLPEGISAPAASPAVQFP